MEQLTEQETDRLTMILDAVVPTLVMLTDILNDDDSELFKKALAQLKDEHGQMSAALPVYLAMGIDPSYSPSAQKSKSMIPVLQKFMELRETILQARREEMALKERLAQREVFRRMTGM